LSELRRPWDFEEPLCAEVGVELFFNVDRDDPKTADMSIGEYSMARKICGECVHKIECAQWGIENETHGMWGGLSPNERAKIRKRTPIGLRVNSTN
jgi:hypothetical protein